jgi:hypothetical protein
LLGDPALHRVSRADWHHVDDDIMDIPHPRNIPKQHRSSLFKRNQYAKRAGWDNLFRVSVNTIKNRYHQGLEKFIGWAKCA